MKFRHRLHLTTETLYQVWLEKPIGNFGVRYQPFAKYFPFTELEEVLHYLHDAKVIFIRSSPSPDHILMGLDRDPVFSIQFLKEFEHFYKLLHQDETYLDYEQFMLSLKKEVNKIKLPIEFKWQDETTYLANKLVRFKSTESMQYKLFKMLLDSDSEVTNSEAIKLTGFKDHNSLRANISTLNTDKLRGSGLKIISRNNCCTLIYS